MPSATTPQAPSSFSATHRPVTPPPVKRKQSNIMTLVTYTIIAALVIVGGMRIFAAPKAPQTVRVVAAGKDIPAGCRLTFSNLHYLDLPPNYYVKGMFNSYDQLIGKTTRTFVPAREPFTANTIISDYRGFVTELPKGFRAVTLTLTPEGLVDGEVRPGDRVDILATTTYKSKRYTKTIMQNTLVVLSTPKEAALSDARSGDQANRVTLAVPPIDAEVLSQAADGSKLRLTLRSLGDYSKSILAGSDERDLLPHEALREVAPVMSPVREGQMMTPAPLPPAPSSSFMPELPPVVQEPVKWVVQMFSGAKKENAEIDVRE